VRLAEGRTAAAESLIREALADTSITPLTRARLLPAAVEIALAARNLVDAENASHEMEQIAETYGTEALRAAAADARGLVSLRTGLAEAAREALRRAKGLWKTIGAPYEAARSGVWLAEALWLAGNPEGARLEAGAVLQAFLKLKASPDAARAEQILAQIGAADSQAPGGTRVTRTLMFTDIVRSTDLVEAIGDGAWESLRTWHDKTIRSLVREHVGEEVDHAGDGFFVAFPSADQAIDCALAIRETIRSHRRDHGFAPSLRIGLHTAPATRTRSGYGGTAVHAAARIGALAGADEIMASEATLSAATRPVPHGSAHAERLKGLKQPIKVVSLS
jgi:class 3 adenylate cyclase